MRKIRIAIVGVGNCASSLVQGIHYYRRRFAEDGRPTDTTGLMHAEIEGYRPWPELPARSALILKIAHGVE